jgi:excisionase family DNA binding protein
LIVTSKAGDALALQTKQVFTTGEAAAVCGVSQQTIIRCFDKGKIDGFRVPGSRFRRIPRAGLLRFMKDNDISCASLGRDKIRTLVVDDDEQIVALLTELLESDGRFEVESADNGYDAGVLTERLMPDLVLLDYMLPDVNGNIVCKRIRSNPMTETTRIIIISGATDRDEIAQMARDGADDFIAKPFHPDVLFSRVGALFTSP